MEKGTKKITEKNSKQAYKKSIMIGFWENKTCSLFSINIGWQSELCYRIYIILITIIHAAYWEQSARRNVWEVSNGVQ